MENRTSLLGKILFTSLLLSLSLNIWAQTKTITGTVISNEDKLPIPGATVIVGHGSTIGTTTDFDGNFTIKVPDTTKALMVSFIGMQSKVVSVGENGKIDVVLFADVLNIEEVVISVPYAKVTKKDFSGSVGVLQSQSLEKGMSENIDKMLQGSAAGVVSSSTSGQPGAKNDVRIRGIGSFNASNEPLYVVDGIPMSGGTGENTLSSINSNDIASVTVCKDAAAASLYGSRASNGVIIITTKQGSKDKTKYSFSSQHGFTQMGNSNFSVLNTDEYLTLRKEALTNAGYINEEIAMQLGNDTVNTNWFDEVFKTAYSSNYELSVSGGNENTKFYLSGAYKNEDGIIIGTALDKISLRLNVDHKASDKFELSAKMGGSVLNQNTIDENGALSSPIVGAYVLAPNVPIYNADGSYYFENGTQNVVGISKLNERTKTVNSFLGNLSAKYNFTKQLNFKSTFGTDYTFSEAWNFIHPITPDGSASNGKGQKIELKSTSWTSSNILSYDKTLENKNSFGVLAGMEAQSFEKHILTVSASNFTSPDARTLSAASNVDGMDELNSPWAIVSALANGRYAISDKYQFTASIRRDYCSRFSPDNRAGNFWSVSAAWRLTGEEFLKNSEKINSLKLRLSYGTSGNAEIGDFAYLGLYGYEFSYNGEPGIALVQIDNSTLTWEKNNNADIGIDFRFYKRFTGSIEVYHRTTWDLLMNVPNSDVNGFGYTLKNHGEMVNKGIELQLTSENIKDKAISWNTDFNISFNNNEITQLYNNEDIEGQTQIRRVGEAYYTFYMPEWAGVNPADGSAMWYDANGNLTTDYSQAVKKVVGKADPLFVSGLTNTFSYKNIDFSFSFFLSYGGLVYNGINQRMISDGAIMGINQSSDALNRWQKPGDITNVPKIVAGNGSNSNDISTRYLEDGTYLRFQNIRIAYNLSKQMLVKAKIASCKLFVQANNLYTWTAYSGLDPEVGVNGIDNFAYPNVRSVSMGVTMNF